jgi:hypothetical protein
MGLCDLRCRLRFDLATQDHDRRTLRRRLPISFSQGARWKALISKYIMTIPFSGDASAEQIMSAPPETAVSSAMIANVGAAARDNQWAAPSLAALPLPAQASAVSCRAATIVLDLAVKSPVIALLLRVLRRFTRYRYGAFRYGVLAVGSEID